MKKIIITLIAIVICDITFAQTTGTLKAVTIIEARTVHLHSKNKESFSGQKSTTTIPIEIPNNTVEWYYSFTTSGSAISANNLKLAAQLIVLLASKTNIAGTAISATGLTDKAINSITVPEGSHAVDIYLFDATNCNNFRTGIQANAIPSGTVETTKNAKVKIKNPISGTYYLGLNNPASMYAVDINIEVVAIVKE